MSTISTDHIDVPIKIYFLMDFLLLELFVMSTVIGIFPSMEPQSKIAHIDDVPDDPVKLFTDLIEAHEIQNTALKYLTMNIATVDSEFGALGRTVVYRGLTDNHITFITERNSRKYLNIMENPKVTVTFFLGKIDLKGIESAWQVRLFGKAVELQPQEISKHWDNEPIFAKIRSRINECGKPVEYNELKEAHDKLLKAYESGEDKLPQTSTFTVFKIVPTVWDFYKAELSNCIADRVQYRKDTSDNKWQVMHVAS